MTKTASWKDVDFRIMGQEDIRIAFIDTCYLYCIIEDGFENSAAYLHPWLDVLKVKDHKTWLVKAASEAQKAADYILGVAAPPKRET